MRIILHGHGTVCLGILHDQRLPKTECSICHQDSIIMTIHQLDEMITRGVG